MKCCLCFNSFVSISDPFFLRCLSLQKHLLLSGNKDTKNRAEKFHPIS
ncbi:hypothetical protein M087_3159 [Bacteroides fragilis str. S23 R14]|nr:hypothetical protein M087_3159 [Bacteroides fragilis str. S23 R14]